MRGLAWLRVPELTQFVPMTPSVWMAVVPWWCEWPEPARVPLAGQGADGGIDPAPPCSLCWLHCRCETGTGAEDAPLTLSAPAGLLSASPCTTWAERTSTQPHLLGVLVGTWVQGGLGFIQLTLSCFHHLFYAAKEKPSRSALPGV